MPRRWRLRDEPGAKVQEVHQEGHTLKAKMPRESKIKLDPR